ncbi:MAG TPA: ABC transporter permease [Clostridiales bacterium]|nr:ABC transporter permease [Clostridiales bacterium]
MEKLKNNPVVKTIGTQRLIALLALIVLFAFFCIASPSFRQYTTFVSIMDASYYIGFMAIGVCYAITTGGIDLSIGTVLVCSSLISGTLFVRDGVPLVLCLIICVLTGTLFGLCNGLMVSKLGLPPFVATLGVMLVSKGFGSIFTKAQSVSWPQVGQNGGWFRYIFKINYTDVAGNQYLVPTGFILLMIMAVIMSIVLNKTRTGRYILALGSNKEATRLSGVNVDKYQTIAYVFSGTFAGIAGLAYAAIYSTLLPGAGGGFEMDAIASVVIGGTSMAGGVATIAGTIIGVYIMAVLKTGLPFIGLMNYWQQLITGVVLVIAVFMDVYNKRPNKRVKAKKSISPDGLGKGKEA